MSSENDHDCISKEELLIKTRSNIEEYGLQVILVSATDYLPSFAYSIGLWETYQHPEVICFDLPEQLGHAIINDVADLIRKEGNIETGKIYTEIFKDSRATFLKIDKRNIKDYFGAALNYYEKEDFEALQLIWTDRNDKFPWEENFEETFLYKQPLLDRNAEFKFYEPKNLSTFTTRQWRDEGKPIVHVAHNSDGYWQFLTGDQTIEDALIVCLEEVIKTDLTLNEIFDLKYGEEAKRDALGGEWTRMKCEEEEEN